MQLKFEYPKKPKPKGGYKQTEVGLIPEDWDVLPVGSMGEVRSGKALAVNAPGKLRPYLRTINVLDGSIALDDVLWMPMTDAEFSRFQIVPGDVLLNEGQTTELVGRCSLYNGEYGKPCAMQNQLLRFRARSGVSEKFAAHLFRQCQKNGVFAGIATQTTSVAHLGLKRFETLKLAWPSSVTEQKAIAKALSDVDALITSLDQLIAKKRDIKQGAMQQLLTGKTRLPGFDGEWEKKQLGELGGFSKGKGIKKDDLVTEGLPCIRYGEIYSEHHDCIRKFTSMIPLITAQKSQRIHSGDILFTCSGETAEDIGKCVAFIGSQEAYAGGDIIIFRPTKKIDSLFLSYLMNHPTIALQKSRMGQGNTVVHISSGSLAQLAMSIPPYDEQKAIAQVLSDMDTEITALEARRDKTKLLKQGMMQELLTGRTRLV